MSRSLESRTALESHGWPEGRASDSEGEKRRCGKLPDHLVARRARPEK